MGSGHEKTGGWILRRVPLELRANRDYVVLAVTTKSVCGGPQPRRWRPPHPSNGPRARSSWWLAGTPAEVWGIVGVLEMTNKGSDQRRQNGFTSVSDQSNSVWARLLKPCQKIYLGMRKVACADNHAASGENFSGSSNAKGK